MRPFAGTMLFIVLAIMFLNVKANYDISHMEPTPQITITTAPQK